MSCPIKTLDGIPIIISFPNKYLSQLLIVCPHYLTQPTPGRPRQMVQSRPQSNAFFKNKISKIYFANYTLNKSFLKNVFFFFTF